MSYLVKNMGAVIALTVLLISAPSSAEIQRPNLNNRNVQQRKPLIKQARNFLRVELEQLPQDLLQLDPHGSAGRHQLTVTPLTLRAMLYIKKARDAGHNVSYAYRTIRGRLTANPRSQEGMTSADKLVVEVTPATFDLWKTYMGPNVLWPSGDSNAGHLYSMIGDQGGGLNFFCNTYGQSNVPASAQNACGKMAAGLLLTDTQMDRLLQAMNAVTTTNKNRVYGYKRRNQQGQEEYPTISCTNWQTSLQIGSKDNHTPEQLQAIRDEVSQRWPDRPQELIGRQPLASIFDLTRAEAPGIWMGKVIMAPKVPVLSYFSATPGTNLAQQVWGLSTIGQIQADGNVTGGAQTPIQE